MRDDIRMRRSLTFTTMQKTSGLGFSKGKVRDMMTFFEVISEDFND